MIDDVAALDYARSPGLFLFELCRITRYCEVTRHLSSCTVVVPARIAAEIELGRAKAYALEGDMEGFLTAFEKGVRMAKELGSEKRKQEAREALSVALAKWPNDQRITGLWELLV